MHNLSILRARASKASMQGVLIAVVAVCIATAAVAYLNEQTITLDSLIRAQKTNLALWVLDCMPFVFGYVAQYASMIMAREASSMVKEQTQELRDRADDLERQANFAATHDQVTELPNRALFRDRIERAIGASLSTRSRFALLLMDIENLKEIRDTLGPGRSDLLIKQVAARLRGMVKSRTAWPASTAIPSPCSSPISSTPARPNAPR